MHAPNASNQRQGNGSICEYLSLVVFPVAFGSAIYLMCRDSNILAFRLFDAFGVSPPNRLDPGRVANPVLCSLPDGLWVFAFASWMRLIWSRHWFWCNLPACMALGSEIGQLYQIIPGTFDLLDVLFYSLGHLISQRVRK
jgi:hypothetical protein